MRDLNKQLRKSYTEALSGITYDNKPVKAYYMEFPKDFTDNNYIVFRGIQSVEVGGQLCSKTETNVTIEISTFKDSVMNNGNAADDIADIVFQRLFPTKQFALTPTGMQITVTQLLFDDTNNFVDQNNKNFIQRILTFKHIIALQ